MVTPAAELFPPGRLRYVDAREAGIRRQPCGRGFRYLHPNGRAVRNAQTLQRLRALAVPPAWREVWLCRDDRGHIQATGRDAAGRKQYRYHPHWCLKRGEAKFACLTVFATRLPRLRAKVRRDLRGRGFSRARIAAAAVRLLDSTLIRVGNREYTRRSRTHGLTTLRDRHVRVDGDCFRLSYRAKGGKLRDISACDAILSRIMRHCLDLPGQPLFTYRDDRGQWVDLDSKDVNDYIQRHSDGAFSAKDFRTWGGTVMAVQILGEMAREGRRDARSLNQGIAEVAAWLGNTRAVCRKYYIHTKVIEAFEAGTLAAALEQAATGPAPSRLRVAERVTYAFLDGH